MEAEDCPTCEGTGYPTDATGRPVVCPVCDGTGVVYLGAEDLLLDERLAIDDDRSELQ